MKPVLGWIKSNLIIVIVMVIAVVAVPTSIIFSMKWNKSIRETVTRRVGEDSRKIDAITVTYEVPAVIPGEQPISVRMTPTTEATRRVTALLDSIRHESAAVREDAIRHNSAGKRLIISGYRGQSLYPKPEVQDPANVLFPQPRDNSASTRLRQQMITEWPEAHRRLLAEYRAGMPPAPDQVLELIERFRDRDIERITGRRENVKLEPEEEAELADQLSQRRLDIYRSAAREISFYAVPEVFALVRPWPQSQLPTLEQLWEWQYLYWVHQDIVRALANANMDARGQWLPVFQAPVKQVRLIQPEPIDALALQASGAPQPGAINDTAELTKDFSRSHTGRVGWPIAANPVYDIRYVTLRIIIDSAGLPALIDAIARTNFMTVIDVDFTFADGLAALESGFDFGPAHVVDATLRIETVWLRHWMIPFMPPSIRDALGIPAPVDEASQPGIGPDATNNLG